MHFSVMFYTSNRQNNRQRHVHQDLIARHMGLCKTSQNAEVFNCNMLKYLKLESPLITFAFYQNHYCLFFFSILSSFSIPFTCPFSHVVPLLFYFSFLFSFNCHLFPNFLFSPLFHGIDIHPFIAPSLCPPFPSI